MRRLFIAFAALLTVSCGPEAYILDLEMRRPSASGDDFTGREMAVVCLDSDRTSSDAISIASTLEKDYFGSKQVVPIYSLERSADADYSCADSLVALVLETGKDVVFLVDGKQFHYYDAMGDGNVKSLPVSSIHSLQSEWKTESFTILYYQDSAWTKAMNYIDSMDWEKAVDQLIYIAASNRNNMQKRACAEYDIAVACYLARRYDLSLEWLDACDADYPVSASLRLRKRIAGKQ